MQHKYTSIAEVQVHMEDEYLRSPLSGVSVQVGMGRSSQVELGMLGLLGGVGLLCSLLGRRNGFFRKRGLGVEGGTGWEPEVSSECLGLNQLLFAPRVRLCALSWHQGEEEVEQVPAEILYQGLLPSLPQYMVSTAGPRGSAPSSWGCLTLRSPSAALSLSSHALRVFFPPSKHITSSILCWGRWPTVGFPRPIFRLSLSSRLLC